MGEWLAASEDAAKVLREALAGEGEAVEGTVKSLLHQSDPERAYDLARCLAATTLGTDLLAGNWTLDFPGIEDAEYETRWVARFLSAHANADDPTRAALFHAAQADGHLTECLLTLAGSAAATLRHRGA